jgi:lactate permease
MGVTYAAHAIAACWHVCLHRHGLYPDGMIVAPLTWTQQYTPVAGSATLSAVVAAIPLIVLLALLAVWHVRAHIAALIGLGCVLALAIGVSGMPPALAGTAALYGAAYGLFPIGWIVLNAIVIYEISVRTGSFEHLKQQVASWAEDRRLQLLLIAFSFGAFVEGAAGFGTPVAICAAMLIGLGFEPRRAAILSLIGNTAPVAFGSLGTPIVVLARVTNLPLDALSTMAGRQLPPFSLLIPFWLVTVLAGWRAMREVWPACLVAGGTFALTQLLVSNTHGPWLVDTASALASMGALVLLLRVWQPATVWRFPNEPSRAATGITTSVDLRRAWTPWLCLSVVVFCWGLPPVKTLFNRIAAPQWPVPLLHDAVLRVPPAVTAATAEDAVFVLNWLSATGTALLVTAVLAGTLLGVRPRALFQIYADVFRRVRVSLVTIAAMLAVGFASRYSGLDTTVGLALAGTGLLFPFFSPLLGWLGVALTGSDTSSNVLFGNLQTVTAQQLHLPPVLTAAANSTGGVMGKMIDAQSIVVASVATRQHGEEGNILRAVFWHSLALVLLVGIWILVQAYLLQWMIPR